MWVGSVQWKLSRTESKTAGRKCRYKKKTKSKKERSPNESSMQRIATSSIQTGIKIGAKVLNARQSGGGGELGGGGAMSQLQTIRYSVDICTEAQ